MKDSSIKIAFVFLQTILMGVFLPCAIFEFSTDANRILLMNIRSRPSCQPIIEMNVQNEIIFQLEHRLNNLANLAERGQDVTEALRDLLEQGRDAILNGNNQRSDYLAVLLTDGTLTLGRDALSAAAEFNQRNITLVAVANGILMYEIWEYYHKFAENTGGAYVLRINAYNLLERAIVLVLNEEYTLRDAFLHIHPFQTEGNNLVNTNSTGAETDGVGDMPFDHGLAE